MNDDPLGNPQAADATRSIISPHDHTSGPRESDPAPPTEIRHYRVQSLLGRGGMGYVYLATDTKLGRQVAIKFLPRSASEEPNARDRFEREARAAAALNHPAICTIHAIEEYEGTPFLVLEYIHGKTFRELTDHPPAGWPPRTQVAASYVLQVAEALRVAHTAGIVHRDIKSSNIMLTEDGRVKILDFGLAKVTDSRMITHDGAIVGTPAYLSPEQARGEAVDHRADLWSLGVVFFEILTRRLPFEAETMSALTSAILFQKPNPVRSFAPEVPAAVERILENLLQQDRNLRYPTAGALISDLRQYLLSSGSTEITEPAAGAAKPAQQAGIGSLLGSSDRRPISFLSIELQVGAETEDPEAWEAALTEMRETCSRIVVSHEGFVRGWEGNAGSACFGYPRAREDAARRAVEAALVIAQAFRRSTAHYAARIGVESSLAVVDMADSSARAVTGEGSVLARTLCHQAELNEVLIGAEIRELVSGLFALGREGSTALAGQRRLEYSGVLQRSTARSRFDTGTIATLTPLTGRGREVEALSAHWEQARQGSGRVVLVSAPAGLGKSRLAYELKSRVANDPSAALIEAFCAPQFANTALYPIVDCIERLVFERETRSMPDEQKLEAIEGLLAGLNSPLPETVPLFAQLLGFPAPKYSPLEVTPEKRRSLTLDALTDMVLERANRQPLLFLVEDLHWADPTTLQLLGQIVSEAAGVSVLAVYTYRPEFTPSWPSRSHVFSMTLDRLTADESGVVAAAAARGRIFDSGTIAEIIHNCDGVPLFLEEMVRAVAQPGSSSSGRATKVAVPTGLRESFLARLDQLGPARNVARLASVMGREFPHWLIAAASGFEEAELRAHLDRLTSADILQRRGTGSGRTYQFKHVLLQEAAYESLLLKSRTKLHEQIGELITSSFPAVAAKHPEVVARHFTEAGLGERAIPYWHQAGMAALERSAYPEALSLFDRGLTTYAALPKERQIPAQELLLTVSRGPTLVATRGFGAQEVGETYRRAEALLATANSEALVMPALWGSWVYHLVRGELKHALEVGRQMIAIAESAKEDAMLLEGCFITGNTLYWIGKFKESKELLERAGSIYDLARFGHHAHFFGQDTLVATLCYQSFGYTALGDFAKAEAASARALEHARALRHPFSIGWSLTFRATLFSFLGRYKDAMDMGQQAVQYCREQAYPFWISAAMAACGFASAQLGDAEGGAALLRESLALTDVIGSLVIQPLYRGQLSEVLLATDAGAALEEADRGLAQATALDVGGSKLELGRLRGLALAALGRKDEAEEHLRKSIEESQKAACRVVELKASMDLAKLFDDYEALRSCYSVLADQPGEIPLLREAARVLSTKGRD